MAEENLQHLPSTTEKPAQNGPIPAPSGSASYNQPLYQPKESQQVSDPSSRASSPLSSQHVHGLLVDPGHDRFTANFNGSPIFRHEALTALIELESIHLDAHHVLDLLHLVNECEEKALQEPGHGPETVELDAHFFKWGGPDESDAKRVQRRIAMHHTLISENLVVLSKIAGGGFGLPSYEELTKECDVLLHEYRTPKPEGAKETDMQGVIDGLQRVVLAEKGEKAGNNDTLKEDGELKQEQLRKMTDIAAAKKQYEDFLPKTTKALFELQKLLNDDAAWKKSEVAPWWKEDPTKGEEPKSLGE
ncbi:hypothetical protein K504DRAFT_114835 [Pleomassaria siparia CBS 279.74]|uniref:Uncharacterized protein n=1 Tax=Pleomassaria siparia CBS 279.74 TaxID=1314801 RepID=A0A6G1JV64_9PLEO|nr:hypothetical protein K504DRAFT_114835 [Pleomassaria siparia CBS 279.74]